MTISQSDVAPPAGLAAVAGNRLLLEEGRSLIRLAAPIMLIALVNMGMSITDAAMVSVLFGADALAAVAVGSDLYSILFYLGAGTLAGLSPFYAASVVRSDPPSGRGWNASAMLPSRSWPPCSSRRSGRRPIGLVRSASILNCSTRGADTRASWRSPCCRCWASPSIERS